MALATSVLIGFGLGAFQLWRTFHLTSESQLNSARVDEIAVVLRANLWIDPQGVPRAPLGGSDDGSRQRLPLWLVGDDRTPWGAHYGWCPVALAAGSGTSTATVRSGDSESYQVDVVSVRQPGIAGKPYVVAARPDFNPGGDPAVVGYVVSPSPDSRALPDCEGIVYRDGFYVIDSSLSANPGTVLALSSAGSVLSSASQGLTSAKFDTVVYVAPSAIGNASGSDPADSMAYADAYALWLSVLPRVTTFVFASGTYVVAPGQSDFRLDAPVRAVRFVGAAGTSLTSPSGAVFRFDGDVVIRNLAIGGGASVVFEPGSRALLMGDSIDSLSVLGGAVDVDPTTIVGVGSLSGGVMRLVDAGTRLHPAPIGPGVVAGAPGSSATVSFGSLAASGGDLVVDGVSLSLSPGSAPTFSAPAHVVIRDGGTVAGSPSTDQSASPSCGSPDSYGRVSCVVTCDSLHPFLKAQSCPVSGGLLNASSLTRDAVTGVETFSCLSRQDLFVTQKQVLVPTGNDPLQPSISTAVDLGTLPVFQPSAAGYCSMNPR